MNWGCSCWIDLTNRGGQNREKKTTPRDEITYAIMDGSFLYLLIGWGAAAAGWDKKPVLVPNMGAVQRAVAEGRAGCFGSAY